ncbi:MAG: hypothetical protein BJ554DRAFT_2105 [Olpidium bornovanus]|uniref:DEP domain-containing protein n=1 Tax=Olpidium bornovanus TaxID=278681 RepID=A0A8H7ZR97_9FUNG|nr:MAG: hypothetical protein BJ554DRAFT_2105 [Olpidium bornovanus]
MDSDMACYLLSEFLQAHLIFNVVDPQSTDAPNDGIYGLTGKGNVLYEIFLRESRQELLASAKPVAGAPADDQSRKAVPPQRKGATLTELVAPSGMLLSLEREPDDDQMVLNQQVIAELFRAFAGKTPNYEEKDKNSLQSPVALSPRDAAAGDTETQSASSSLNMATAPGVDEQEVTAKVSVNGVRLRDRTQVFKKVKMTFHGRVAIDWLMAHTTLVNREEAAKLADKFLANGYIRSVGDSSPEFRDVKQVVYAFTDEGQRVAGWDVGEGSKGRALSGDMKGNPSSFLPIGLFKTEGRP